MAGGLPKNAGVEKAKGVRSRAVKSRGERILGGADLCAGRATTMGETAEKKRVKQETKQKEAEKAEVREARNRHT